MSNRTVTICLTVRDRDKLDTMLEFAQATGNRTGWIKEEIGESISVVASFSEVASMDEFLDAPRWRERRARA